MTTVWKERMNTQEASVTPVRLSGAELAALVELVDNDAAREVARRLRLDQLPTPETAVRFGMSALIARGFAVVEGEDVSSAEEATVIATVLGRAESFAEIGLVAETQSEGALLVVSPLGTILFGASSGETYECIAVQPDLDLGTVVAGMVFAFLDNHAEAAGAVTLTSPRGETKVAVRRRPDDDWEVATGSFDDEGKLPVVGSTRAAAHTTLSQMWNAA